MTYLSVIIPAYNEGQRIGETLLKIGEFFKKKNYDYEIIVVDDGSSDDTILKAESSIVATEGRLRVVKNGINKGKGFSVKSGILNSSAEFILFSDADISTPIEEVDRLLEYVKKDYDVVIGSRSITGSSVVVHQPWYRELMGKVFNLFVKMLIMRGFNDTQCGFKLFKGDVAREIARHMRINGFAFDVEMLHIAKIKKYNIKECGVLWENSPESKVKLFHSPLNMFLDLFKIKVIHAHLK